MTVIYAYSFGNTCICIIKLSAITFDHFPDFWDICLLQVRFCCIFDRLCASQKFSLHLLTVSNKFSENLHHRLTMFRAIFLISSIFSTCFPTIFTTFFHTWLYWYYYKFKTMWTWWLVFRYWNCAKHYHAVVQYTFQRLWWFVVDYGNYIDSDWTSTCPNIRFYLSLCNSKHLPILDKDNFVDRQTDRHRGKKTCTLIIFTDFQFKPRH